LVPSAKRAMRVQRHLDLLGAIATTLVWILSRIKGERALAIRLGLQVCTRHGS
jgi:hypothetical protein